jgi:hypothetical protein
MVGRPSLILNAVCPYHAQPRVREWISASTVELGDRCVLGASRRPVHSTSVQHRVCTQCDADRQTEQAARAVRPELGISGRCRGVRPVTCGGRSRRHSSAPAQMPRRPASTAGRLRACTSGPRARCPLQIWRRTQSLRGQRSGPPTASRSTAAMCKGGMQRGGGGWCQKSPPCALRGYAHPGRSTILPNLFHPHKQPEKQSLVGRATLHSACPMVIDETVTRTSHGSRAWDWAWGYG